MNRQLAREPAQATDVHRPVPANLDETLGWEEARVVQRDWTVTWPGRWFQIERSEERRNLVGRPITARRLRDGRLQWLDRGQKLRWRERPARPARVQAVARAVGRTQRLKPGAEHPWRAFGMAAGKRYWRAAQTPISFQTQPALISPQLTIDRQYRDDVS